MTPKSHTLSCPNPEGNTGTHDVHVLEWGPENAGKVAVCVHALTRNARDFDPLAQKLVAQGYRVVCPDVVGRGKSGWLENADDYGYVTYVTDTLHVMESLGTGQVDFIGTSMGGLIGMMLAANVPGIVNKLVMNDIGPFIPKRALEGIGEYVGQVPPLESKEAGRGYLKERFADSWGLRDEDLDHLAEHSVVKADNGSYRLAYDPAIGNAFRDNDGKQKLMQDVDIWPIWEQLQCPVLVLRGSESDLLPEHVAMAMAKRPNTELIQYDGLGHAPSLMLPQHREDVTEWLAR